MRWQDFRRSENVEEREDGAPSGFGVGGFKLGGGAILIVVIVSLLLGKNPLDVLTLLEGGAPPQVSVPTSPTGSPSTRPANDPQHDFVVQLRRESVDYRTGTADGADSLELPSEAFIRLVYGRLDADNTPSLSDPAGVLDELRTVFPGP